MRRFVSLDGCLYLNKGRTWLINGTLFQIKTTFMAYTTLLVSWLVSGSELGSRSAQRSVCYLFIYLFLVLWSLSIFVIKYFIAIVDSVVIFTKLYLTLLFLV